MDDLLLRSSQPKPSSYHRRPNLKFEECIIGGEKIKLPQALCENSELFQELFSVDSWNAFTEQQRRHLMQFLPSFRENEMEEKSYTLKLLFSGGEFRFGSNPLVEFSKKLNAGYYCADIVNIQQLLKKARHKEYLKRQRVYYYKVLKHSLVMRHKLLESAKDLQLGSSLPSQTSNVDPTAVKRKIDRASLERRVKHRYYQELISIKKETGDTSDSSYDENYPEGFIPPPFTKKHRKQICQLEESFNAVFDQPVISTLSRPDCLDLSRLVLNVDNPFDMTEDKYKEMLKQYNKHHKNLHPYIKIQNKNKPEKSASSSKPQKEAKPMRKRRPRKTPASMKASPKKPAETPLNIETTPLNDPFGKPTLNTFKFPEPNPLEKKFEAMQSPIKQERLEDFATSCDDVKPNQLLLDQELTLKEEMAMKEEQDQAVAALLKQEDADVDVNVYIKSEDDKSSVLLFDEFDHHHPLIKEEQDTKHSPSSEYLLTPESYSVALQSVVTNTTPSFKKTTVVEPKKSTPLQAIPVPIPIISQVEDLHFDPLSIDTIAETPFTSSPPVTAAVPASGIAPTMATISPSVTDLDSMNVMDLGPLNVEDTEPPPSREKPPAELMHNAHSSFFSLIREIVCSTWDHRMDLRNLQKRIDTWYDNAVSPLNSWYMNQSWPSLLQNAVTFLAGQCPEDLLPAEYVPYIEYKSNLDIYQWIGAGRDSDAKLTLLCDTWLKNKDEVAGRVMEDESILPFVLHEDFEFKREQRAVSPAASRFPTDWVVQLSTKEEKADFQKQEKLRFQNPNAPFAYRIHGYQTVVGPVNMNYAIPNSNKISKGSSLLVESRPYYVTIMALVQDASARLPNGEGTRQDIVTLLKDSQYLSQNIINCVLHGAVTSSLERLQLESDPCIKYDARRKTWIYLHRSRSMNDFEMMEAVKPKTARKAAVWKLRRDYNPAVTTPANATPSKSEGATSRSVKEAKVNVRAIKSLGPAKAAADGKAMAVKSTPVRNTTVAPAPAKTEAKVNILHAQPNIIQAVIQDSSANRNTEETQMINVHAMAAVEKARAQLLKAVDLKGMAKSVMKGARPSIIKKTIIKDPTPVSSAIAANVGKTNVLDTKSILTSSNLLSANTIVKLINAKSLKTSDAVKGAKTIAQISPQQIVVIKQPDDGSSPSDKKHTILLKQLQQHAQNQQRLSLANLQKCQPRIVTSDQRSPLSSITATCESRVGDLITTTTTTTTTTRVVEPHLSSAKQDSLLKQKQLHQLLVKHQNELKLQQSGVKELQTVTLQQSKVLPKQMIVVKQNQGQIVAETQSVVGKEEASGISSVHKQITSPVVILNKQQYQQQLHNSKPQIIQLPSGQQVTAQQIQQMLLKQQQQQHLMKRVQQQQQIVVLKPDLQASAGQQQQIVMLKQQSAQPQQQLVMIKQSMMGQQQKIQQKQPQTQVIQIANSAGLMTPMTADLSKVSVACTAPRMQKIPMSAATMIAQNTKTVNAVGTAISVSVSKPTMPTYTVVAVGQQQKVFPQNNQHLQILTSTNNTVNNSQTVVLPNSGALTLLQQAPMQQVLLPTGFNSPGMINLKTLQGLKVIPISTQSTATLRGQPVFTRLVNSGAVRPVLIQDDLSAPTSANTTNLH